MLVGHSNIRKRDFTLDIGAGSGVFTFALSKKSAQVLAIESDRETFKKLQNNTKNLENVEVLCADFLHFNLSKLPKNYKVCANIPFHLSSPIIQKLTNAQNSPKSIYLILQKQFARKLIVSDKNFTSALGVKIFPFFESKIGEAAYTAECFIKFMENAFTKTQRFNVNSKCVGFNSCIQNLGICPFFFIFSLIIRKEFSIYHRVEKAYNFFRRIH